MAFITDDFEKVWASTSPLTPYEFSDSNYQQGWNFIGSTPPARQMWDFLQKQNDEKAQWLYNNKLSLSGGTMTGNITLADGGNPLSTAGGTMTGNITLADGGNPLSTAGGTMTGNITLADGGIPLSTAGGTMLGAIHYNGANNRSFGFNLTNNQANMDIGWNLENRDGAGIGLRSTDENASGSFSIYARDGSNSTSLNGFPNGSLTWGGKEVERVNASGSNYIRYESGLQICWGSVTATSSGTQQTFDKPFSGDPRVVVSAGGYSIGSGHQDESSTGFKATTNQSSGAWVAWIAIGKWK